MCHGRSHFPSPTLRTPWLLAIPAAHRPPPIQVLLPPSLFPLPTPTRSHHHYPNHTSLRRTNHARAEARGSRPREALVPHVLVSLGGLLLPPSPPRRLSVYLAPWPLFLLGDDRVGDGTRRTAYQTANTKRQIRTRHQTPDGRGRGRGNPVYQRTHTSTLPRWVRRVTSPHPISSHPRPPRSSHMLPSPPSSLKFFSFFPCRHAYLRPAALGRLPRTVPSAADDVRTYTEPLLLVLVVCMPFSDPRRRRRGVAFLVRPRKLRHRCPPCAVSRLWNATLVLSHRLVSALALSLSVPITYRDRDSERH